MNNINNSLSNTLVMASAILLKQKQITLSEIKALQPESFSENDPLKVVDALSMLYNTQIVSRKVDNYPIPYWETCLLLR